MEKSWGSLLNEENLKETQNLKELGEINKKDSKEEGDIDKNIRINIKERVYVFMAFVLAIMIISYTFFENIVAFVVLLILYIPVRKIVFGEIIIRKKKRVLYEFKDTLKMIENSISAGTSLENAAIDSYRQILNIYGNNSVMAKELKRLENRLKINISIEQAFKEMAIRIPIEEIRLYANLLAVTKRTGGDVYEITEDVSKLIERKIEVENEIDVAIASKKYEQSILAFMPIIMILYVKISNKGFMDVMYETFAGRIIMTIALLIYGMSVYWAIRILRFDI